MLAKKIIVVHSGGMDSSLCLALAARDFGPEAVLSMGFNYGQRHSKELFQAQKISDHFNIDRIVINIDCLAQITQNSLTNHQLEIEQTDGAPPNTLVVGRNGLMARIAAIHADSLGARKISMGVIEVEEANSGYRDCSRQYMDLMENILRIDLGNNDFEIITPLVKMTKLQTMELGHQLGVLEFLLEETITCYKGMMKAGCKTCPACKLRNEGIKQFLIKCPQLNFSYRQSI